MRARNLVMFATMAVLLCVFLSTPFVMASRKAMRLDGEVRHVDFSKSVPNDLNYQGYLVDATDTSAVTAVLAMTFRIYDAETMGSELWSETHPGVSVVNGLFNVLLGSVTPFPGGLFDGSALWLQTEVGAEILTPRKPLVSVAYSHRAVMADHATVADSAIVVGTADGDWTVSNSDMYSAVSGNVGIGRTSPDTKLDTPGPVRIGDPSYTPTSAVGLWLAANDNAGSIPLAIVNPNLDYILYARGSGDVGIGTHYPQQKLQVHGDFPQQRLTNTLRPDWFTVGTGWGGLSFDDNFGNEPFFIPYNTPHATLVLDTTGGVHIGSWDVPRGGLEITSDIDDSELWLTELGTTTSDHAQIYFDSDSIDYRLGVNSGTGILYIWPSGYGDALDINASGYWITLNYDTFVYGDFEVFGGTKNFVEEDPVDPTKMIVYACLEGPEAGTYQRGTAQLVGGKAVIELPDHFAKVTAQEGLTIHLTPVGTWLQLYVVEKSPTYIVVAEATGHDGTFDYLIQGVRKGYEDYEVVRDRSEFPALRARGLVQGGPPGTESPAVRTRPLEEGKGNLQ
jgi:hypothetical protein